MRAGCGAVDLTAPDINVKFQRDQLRRQVSAYHVLQRPLSSLRFLAQDNRLCLILPSIQPAFRLQHWY